jgi:hypothetical protein
MKQTGNRDEDLRARAQQVIPGGMYGHQSVSLLPDSFPQFFSRAKGAATVRICLVTDLSRSIRQRPANRCWATS